MLDPHWGTLADWQAAIDEIHSRGMFVMADFTVGTMADLVGFKGYVRHVLPVSSSTYLSQFLERVHAFLTQRIRRSVEGPFVRALGI